MDAPPPPEDGAPDTPPAVTTVNITAYNRAYETGPAKTPREGVTVVAVATSGTVTDTKTTGADGKATVSLPDGGSVTVVYPEDANQRNWATTYIGVKPGDNLTFGDVYNQYDNRNITGLGTMTVTWPAVANATGYRLYAPCVNGNGYDGATTSATFTLQDYCYAATGRLVLVATNGGNVIASAYLPTAAFAASTQLDLTAGQWVAQANATNYNVTMTGIATDTVLQDLGAWGVYGSTGLYGTFGYDQFVSDPTVANNAAAVMVSLPSTAVRQFAFGRLRHSTMNGRQSHYKSGASPVSLDASTLPWISAVNVDQKAHTVSWTQTAGTYDATALRFTWDRLDGSDVNHRYWWTVVLPPGITSLDGSTLPAELAAYVPTASDSFNLNNVRVIDLADAASYDAARALPEWQLTSTDHAVESDLTAGAFADGGEGSYGPWDYYY